MRIVAAQPSRMSIRYRERKLHGLSLAELLVALTIGSMVLVAVLTVYDRAERAAQAVTRRLDESQLPGEVLQRIAEDLDRLVGPGSDAKIEIENKFDQGYPAARLVITSSIRDENNREQVLERVIWQSSYDVESSMPGLVLYRSHSGITLEDKLLDSQRAELEKQYPFIPLCSGVTMFQIDVPQGDEYMDRWDSDTPPNGIRVTLSFAEASQTPGGTFEVPEHQQIIRMIATDRTRKIKFEIAPLKDTNQSGMPTEQPVDKTPATIDEMPAPDEKALLDRAKNAPGKPKPTR